MTVEEFLNDIRFVTYSQEEKLITFAKIHVEQALKEASENVEIEDYDEHMQYSPSVNEKSILNAYPLENIK